MNKIGQSYHLRFWFILAILISSCLRASTAENPLSPSPALTTTRSTTQSTSTPSSAPASLYTPSPDLTSTSEPTNIPSLSTPRASRDDEKLYIDPMGWFSVYIPIDWEEAEIPGVFSGQDGFAEIGFLPKLGFMDRKLSVSVWLANIIETPESSNIWLSGRFETFTETGETIVQTIFKNPAAEYEHRFVHLKADQEHFAWIENSFVWLRPEILETELEYYLMEPRPEDASSLSCYISL